METELYRRLMKMAIIYNEIEADSDRRFMRMLLAKGAMVEIEAEITVSRKKGNDFFNIDDDTVKTLKNAIEEFYAIAGKLKESNIVINQLRVILDWKNQEIKRLEEENQVLNKIVNLTD